MLHNGGGLLQADLSQAQNPRFSNTKALVLFNRKIKISGKRVLKIQDNTALKFLKSIHDEYIIG